MKRLTPHHFPKEGNESFSGAGERSQYAEQSFSLSLLEAYQGYAVGTLITIDQPPRLERIGRSIFTETSIGLVPLKSIAKPGESCNRSAYGKAAQDAAIDYLSELYEFDLISTSVPGSKKPDIVGAVGHHHVQVEIKSVKTRASVISIFDKSVRRGQPCPVLDALAQVTVGAPSFEEMVDTFTEEPRCSGFAEDEWTSKSGSMSASLNYELAYHLVPAREMIIAHLENSGDTHLGIYDRSSGDISIYAVSDSDPLGLAPIPALRSFCLATHGGPSMGATRVGVRIRL